jgi:hypothetical protein
MIKEWYNTKGMTLAGMVGVSDEDILRDSSGIVTQVINPEDPNVRKGTVLDQAIFGELRDGEICDMYGHIVLAEPVVNIQYYLGRCPKLARVLGMSRKDLDRVIYQSGYAVTDPGTTGFKRKQVLSEKEYMEALGKYGTDKFTVQMGGQAIETLLAQGDVKERECMVLHVIPVLPLGLRFVPLNAPVAGRREALLDILYNQLLERNARLAKMKEVKAADIILRNERRMVQETVDTIISNGQRKSAVTSTRGGIPYLSMDEVYHHISDMDVTRTKHPGISLDHDIVAAAVCAYWEFESKDWEDTEDVPGQEIDLSAAKWEDVDPQKMEEDETKRQELADAIRESVWSFVDAYMKVNYPACEEYARRRAWGFATSNIPDSARFLWPEKNKQPVSGDPFEWLEKGLMETADVYVKKQMKWDLGGKEAAGDGRI